MKFIELLDREYAVPGKICEFSSLAQFFTLDVISSLLWSEPIGFLDQGADIGGYLQTLEKFMPIRAALGAIPVSLLSLLTNRLLPTPEDKFGLGRLMGFAKQAVDRRLRQLESGAEEGKKRDMMGAFMAKGLKGDRLLSELSLALYVSP